MSDIDSFTSEEKEQLSEIPIVWMIGPPCSGGFSQSKKIIDDYGCTIINLHKEKVLVNTDFEKFGELSDKEKEEIQEIFWNKIQEIFWNKIVHSLRTALHFRNMTFNKFPWILIEHYPRSVEQALRFEKEIKSPSLILRLNLEDDVCKERAKSAENPGGQEYDDEIMDRKLRAYHEYTEPICHDENFRNKCIEIDASKIREEVHRDIRFELSKIGIKKRRAFVDDSAEQYYRGLSPGGLLGISAGIITASVLDIIPKEAKNVLTSIAAVTGLMGCTMIGASIYNYLKNNATVRFTYESEAIRLQMQL